MLSYERDTEINEAIDLTEEEYKLFLSYVHPQSLYDEGPTDHELLLRISRRAGVVSTFLIIYVILSIIAGIIIGISLA